MKMDLKYIFVLVGFICVIDAQASPTELSRQKRDVNVVEIFLQVQQLLDSCKKPNQPAATNETNPVNQFIESHDLECLFNGFLKIFKELNPPSKNSRRKRDALNIVMEFLQLQQDVEKCKKPNQPASNSTNILENIMDDYDLGCLFTTVFNFLKTITSQVTQTPPNNQHQRSKRAIQISDITCFIMQIMNRESKIDEVVKAYKSQGPRRHKRAATSQQICDDFGTLMDSVLKFILDFAPNQAA